MKKNATMELELATLQELTMKDQSKISSSLLNVDEGNCLFPRNELIPLTIILTKSVVLIILNLI